MLPSRCSIKDIPGDCPNPPTHVVSIVMENSGEYMVGVVCEEHRNEMENRLRVMQKAGNLVQGSIKLVSLKSVGTNCVFSDDNDKKNISFSNHSA